MDTINIVSSSDIVGQSNKTKIWVGNKTQSKILDSKKSIYIDVLVYSYA